MDNILGLIGAISGVAGLLISVLVVRWQMKVQEKNDRMAFLTNVMFDTTIDRESRQPFYDEYIAKKGNGTVVKFWMLEGKKQREENANRT